MTGFYGVDYEEPFDPGPEDNPTLTPEADDEVERWAAFNRRVHHEADRLRVRRAAQEIVAREDEPPAQPFDAGTLAEVLARPEEPPARVEGLIPWEASTLIVAQRKTGKTTLALNLGRSLLTGEDFLDRFPVRPVEGVVALLNFEVAARTAARWGQECGVPGDRLLLVNLRGRRNPLGHPGDREMLAKHLRERAVESLVVDPFGRAYSGVSQNDAGEVGRWLVDLDVFARSEVGARDLLLTTHAGWNGERSRGSSALEDWADSIITLNRDETTDARFMRAVGRDVELAEDRLEFHAPTRRLWLTGDGSRALAKDERKLRELAVLVVRAAHYAPGLGVAEMEAAIRDMDDAPGFRNGDVSKAAKYAAAHGQMRIESDGQGRKLHHYAVDPANPSRPIPDPSPG